MYDQATAYTSPVTLATYGPADGTLDLEPSDREDGTYDEELNFAEIRGDASTAGVHVFEPNIENELIFTPGSPSAAGSFRQSAFAD